MPRSSLLGDVDFPWCDACNSYHHPQNVTCKLIKLYYESDGERGARTHYIIAKHPKWSDDLRMDFNDKKTARVILGKLRRHELSLSQAETDGRRWL